MPQPSPLTAGLPLPQRLTLLLSSCGGLGHLPLAPGTWGSLAGLPLWWAMAGLPAATQALGVLLLTVASIGVCARAEQIYGAHDVQRIVLDEVVGMLTCALWLPFAWPQVVLAFALFRLLDAAKPWPIGWVDRRVRGGAGVVLDDSLAGAIGCAIMHAMTFALKG